jgi:hypothetical protein
MQPARGDRGNVTFSHFCDRAAGLHRDIHVLTVLSATIFVKGADNNRNN